MKNSKHFFLLFIILICIQISQAAISEPYGEIAEEHLMVLSDTIGARFPGSEEEKIAADYIITQAEEMGYVPVIQSFTYFDEDDKEHGSQNIIIEKKGSSSKQIIIGAHYDSMDEGSGADDNGSGVAVLLELAQRISEMNTSYSITFVAFGAEEHDLAGSWYYVNELNMKDRNSIIGFINLDGFIAGNILYLYGDSGSTLYDFAENVPGNEEFTFLSTDYLIEEDGSPCYCGDFSPFQESGIPILFIEATDYTQGEEDGWTQVDMKYGDKGIIRHTMYDNLQYINTTFPGRIKERLSVVTHFISNLLNIS